MKYYMEIYNGKEWKRSTLESTEDRHVARVVKQHIEARCYTRMVNGDNVVVDHDDYDGTNAAVRLTDEYQLGFTAGWDAALKWAYPG